MAIEAIWKYELETTDEQSIEMPEGAQILALQVQNGQPCLWAQGDPEKQRQRRHFRIYGTGHSIISIENKRLEYVGTYQSLGGAFVGHVYELKDY